MATEQHEATPEQAVETRIAASAHAHHLPAPTLAPITMAGGIALMCLGVVTSHLISLAGIVVIAWGLGAWIGDLRRDARHTAAAAKEKNADE